MRHCGILLLLVASLGWTNLDGLGARPAYGQADLADTIERCEKSLVRIEVKIGNSGGGQGSGFVVGSDGIIVTNVHVLRGGDAAIATFPDGKRFTVEGTYLLDPERDIAIAKINGNGLPSLSIAATAARKGEQVSALGSPLGLSFTATNGIVSAIRTSEELKKELGERDLKGTWIQVDAALSPGNSGGPLINRKGEVVAMSTLASSGIAQNINFGISAGDIQAALDASKTKSLIPLAAGAAKLKSKDREERGSPGDPDSLKLKPIPVDAIEAYLKNTKDSLKDLNRGMLAEKSRIAGEIKEMKAGETALPSAAGEADAVRVQGRKGSKWYFRNAQIKQKEIQRQETRVKAMAKASEKMSNGSEKEKTFALATSFGPPLDPQSEGSIGFMSNATVLRSFTKHEVLIIYDNAPYMMLMDSTAGLFTGQEINPTAVLVAGTSTANVKGTPMTITILQSVSDDEIKKVAFGDSVPGEEFRVWKSKDGSYKIEASLISVNAKEVTLKRKDNGKEIKVPVAKLCDEDQKFLGK